MRSSKGLSLLEIIVAVGVVGTVILVGAGLVTQGWNISRLGEENVMARGYAAEGVEAVRAIRDRDWNLLSAGSFGLDRTSGEWVLSGSSDSQGNMTRVVELTQVQRSSGEVVGSGGVIDENTFRVKSRVSWPFSPMRNLDVELVSYVTNWASMIANLSCDWSGGASVIGTGDPGGNVEPNAVFVVGDYAFVSVDREGGDRELFVMDVSNVGSITQVGSLEINGDVHDVWVEGSVAYLATGENDSEIWSVNVGSPSSPTVQGKLNLSGNSDVFGVFVVGDYAYVGRDDGSGSAREFYIISVSNPSSMSVVGSLEFGSDVNEVFVNGSFAYLSTDSDSQELVVVNVSDVRSPSVVGSINLNGSANAESVWVSGSYAYVGREQSGTSNEFAVVDVSNLGSMSVVGNFDVGHSVRDVMVSGVNAYLAVANNNEGFWVLNVDAVSSVSKVLGLDIGADARGVFVDASSCYVYVANDSNGEELQVIGPNQVVTPTPAPTSTSTPTPTPTPVVSSCSSYCASLPAHSGGSCRIDPLACFLLGEDYESGGNGYCPGTGDAFWQDTCCCW